MIILARKPRLACSGSSGSFKLVRPQAGSSGLALARPACLGSSGLIPARLDSSGSSGLIQALGCVPGQALPPKDCQDSSGLSG